MKKILLSTATIAMLSGEIVAAETENTPRTVRQILGEVKPLEHTDAQIRVGYIDWNAEGDTADPDNSAFAVGGHIHLDSKRWHGLMVGAEAYVVADPGLGDDNPDGVNPDFFDADKKGFATLSQAFIDGKWGETEIKIGRQMIDTPHADSDDIRMMPNYFLAYLLTNSDIKGLTLTLGQVDQMGGWENGIDAKKFVPVEKVLGAEASCDGIYLASAVYEGFENLSLQAWYYAMIDIADVVYLEAGYTLPTSVAEFVFGLQYDTAKERGDELLGKIDSSTVGVSIEAGFENGVTLMAAYNSDNGDTGAFGSLGGGPFFTSMEDQTLDAIGQRGDAWMGAIGYDFGGIGLEGLNAGLAYAHFEADKRDAYETDEIDIAAEYAVAETLQLTVAYAIVDDRTDANEDFSQLRLIANYNFNT
ncbi:OprD family outer membrane porin [Hydrogenimonas urashimensis]|uniref:OprD family outer membrane porin n=1 Tax=Hydrogenimonas urashimensis TaxID=2740515 RepID=UPI0019157C62|nr:OprD family outer membrane porin [Hydrogenimonas urashimensis]